MRNQGKSCELCPVSTEICSFWGALYPNELYVYVKLEDTPKGIYHYDVAHHRLILVREGNYDCTYPEVLRMAIIFLTVFALFLSRQFFGKISINIIIFPTGSKG